MELSKPTKALMVFANVIFKLSKQQVKVNDTNSSSIDLLNKP